MILEADVVFDSQVSTVYQNDLPRFLAVSDIVKFEGIPISTHIENPDSDCAGRTSELVIRVKPTLGAAAYAVTKDGRHRLAQGILCAADSPCIIS